MANELFKIRCSALPRIMRCGASAEPPLVSVSEWSDPADVGTRVHAMLRAVVEGKDVDLDGLDSETRFLVGSGITLWNGWRGAIALREVFPLAVCERELELEFDGFSLSGHSDVRSSSAVGGVRILDWKSGRVDHDYSEQMLGYCALELANNAFVERAEAHIVWLREREVESWSMTRDELRPWLERVSDAVSVRRIVYGSHCVFCPRAHECTGRAAVVRSDVESILEMDVDELRGGLATMAPDRVIHLLRQARAVAKVSDRVVEAIRMHVAEAGEVVGSESRIAFSEQKRRQLDAERAWTVLQRHLSDDDLIRAVKISLPAVEDAVAKAAGKGAGAAAKRKLTADLEAVSAISTSTTKVLSERRNA